MHSLVIFDPQVGVYTLLALIPNLFIILWAMARLSRDVRLLKHKNATLEDDINLLDQSISNLTTELQGIRLSENRKLGFSDKTSAPPSGKASG
jgi:hypothetical protein